MASTVVDQPLAPEQAPRKGWIDRWDPEDAEFWETTGRGIARRNLAFSILAEHLGFSVWVLWSIVAANLDSVGFAFTEGQLFWLVAVPNLVGATLRPPYTFAVPRFGGSGTSSRRCYSCCRRSVWSSGPFPSAQVGNRGSATELHARSFVVGVDTHALSHMRAFLACTSTIQRYYVPVVNNTE